MSSLSSERGKERTQVSEALRGIVVRLISRFLFTAATYSSMDCFSRTNLLVADADISLARAAETPPLSVNMAREIADMSMVDA